jgi:hypothetical protein
MIAMLALHSLWISDPPNFVPFGNSQSPSSGRDQKQDSAATGQEEVSISYNCNFRSIFSAVIHASFGDHKRIDTRQLNHAMHRSCEMQPTG